MNLVNKNQPKLSEFCDVIIVTYNSSAVIDQCLKSLIGYNSSCLNRIFVVDNSSIDDTAQIVANTQKKFPGISFLRMPWNLGFAKANNHGASLSQTNFMVFLNPDTIFQDNAIEQLFDLLLQKEHIGVIGPALVFPDNTVQRGYGDKLGIAGIMRDFLLGARLRAKLQNQRKMISPNVDWVSGACMIVRKDVFEMVGGFDEKIFMYSEDLDLCLRIKQKGFKVYYLPSVRVIHLGGISQKSNKITALKANISSRLYYTKKYYGLCSFLIILFFMYGYAFTRLLLHLSLSLFSGKHKEYARIYIAILSSMNQIKKHSFN